MKHRDRKEKIRNGEIAQHNEVSKKTMSAPQPIQPGEYTIMEHSTTECVVMVCTGTVTIGERILPCFQATSKPKPYRAGFSQALAANNKRDPKLEQQWGQHTDAVHYVLVTQREVHWAVETLNFVQGDLDNLRKMIHRGGTPTIEWVLKVFGAAKKLCREDVGAEALYNRLKEEGLGAFVPQPLSPNYVPNEDSNYMSSLWGVVDGTVKQIADLILEQCAPLGWTPLYISMVLESIKWRMSSTNTLDAVIIDIRDRSFWDDDDHLLGEIAQHNEVKTA